MMSKLAATILAVAALLVLIVGPVASAGSPAPGAPATMGTTQGTSISVPGGDAAVPGGVVEDDQTRFGTLDDLQGLPVEAIPGSGTVSKSPTLTDPVCPNQEPCE